MAGSADVVLYGAPDCSLCDLARPALEGLVARHGGALREVNIRRDAALEERYGDRIPVVTIDGAEVSEGRFARAAVRAALLRAAARP